MRRLLHHKEVGRYAFLISEKRGSMVKLLQPSCYCRGRADPTVQPRWKKEERELENRLTFWPEERHVADFFFFNLNQ